MKIRVFPKQQETIAFDYLRTGDVFKPASKPISKLTNVPLDILCIKTSPDTYIATYLNSKNDDTIWGSYKWSEDAFHGPLIKCFATLEIDED